jgi:hypothetical protein
MKTIFIVFSIILLNLPLFADEPRLCNELKRDIHGLREIFRNLVDTSMHPKDYYKRASTIMPFYTYNLILDSNNRIDKCKKIDWNNFFKGFTILIRDDVGFNENYRLYITEKPIIRMLVGALDST